MAEDQKVCWERLRAQGYSMVHTIRNLTERSRFIWTARIQSCNVQDQKGCSEITLVTAHTDAMTRRQDAMLLVTGGIGCRGQRPQGRVRKIEQVGEVQDHSNACHVSKLTVIDQDGKQRCWFQDICWELHLRP